jgi:hypothetical protein
MHPDCHAKAYEDNPDTYLLVLCDKDEDKVIDVACSLDIPIVGDISAIPNESIDICSVCTPPDTHLEIVREIAPWVKAIWLEKPIALTVDDGRKIIDICKENKVTLVVNHQRNFMQPVFRFSRDIINTGTHLFALLDHLNLKNVRIEYIPTDEHIFEFDILHNKERMLPNVLKTLIYWMEHGKEGNGENALRALEEAIRFKDEYVR